MPVSITVTWHNANPNTIFNRLAVTLGRTPTDAEASAAVRRILTASLIERAGKGQLPHQR